MAKGKAGQPAGDSDGTQRAFIHRTIPNRKSAALSVTVASQTTADWLALYPGRFIWLLSKGTDTTVLRGSATVVLSEGLICKEGVPQEVFIDPAGEMNLSYIGAANGSLMVLDDNEIG